MRVDLIILWLYANALDVAYGLWAAIAFIAVAAALAYLYLGRSK